MLVMEDIKRVFVLNEGLGKRWEGQMEKNSSVIVVLVIGRKSQ